MAFTGLNYNGGTEVNPSTVDNKDKNGQLNSFWHLRKAIIEARKEQFFMPLASVTDMPKHYGKTAKVYRYVPLLDELNENDQGIDAQGVQTVNGNIYGSSRDIGLIKKTIPALTENGGRVNRVGFTRVLIEGSISKFGFFYELSQEALDFDSDSDLQEHLSRESMTGAVQMTEAAIQIDLLEAADSEVYPGGVAAMDDLTGVAIDPEDIGVVTYNEMEQLDILLTENRTPYRTKIINGSRFIDTAVINAARVMYVGIDIVPHLKRMKDPFGNAAFISVEHYAAAGTVLNGEIGTIGSFRLILVPEMLHWAAKGAEVVGGDDGGYRASTNDLGEERWDVAPMLVVGDDSFTTLGFQSNGKTLNFNVITKLPGRDNAGYNEPYGELGFSSTKWYYGTLIKRPERIGIIKTLVPAM